VAVRLRKNTTDDMQGRILVSTNLTRESNSIVPLAVTIAQAFPNKLYLLHVMPPDSVNEPERLEDFPSLTEFFRADRDTHFTPPLKASVPVAKMYLYNNSVPRVILGTAKAKNVDLICLPAIRAGSNFAWCSAGDIVETVIEKATCSVLCARGRDLKESHWQRPRLRHMLLLTELTEGRAVPLDKVMPWVHRFNSMLHIFPIGDISRPGEQEHLRKLCHTEEARTNVLLFKKPRNRTENLLRFIADTPVDLIMMTPRARERFSSRLVNDVFVKLLRVTDVPVLLLR
jgi:nucleotide-binding universal stress UspA family protein